MGIYLDEPLAVLAASAFTVAGGVIGAWWQRHRKPDHPQLPMRVSDSPLLDARLDRLEQIAEATALEVERVAEGQRFTTRVLAERDGRGIAPPAAPLRSPDYRTPH